MEVMSFNLTLHQVLPSNNNYFPLEIYMADGRDDGIHQGVDEHLSEATHNNSNNCASEQSASEADNASNNSADNAKQQENQRANGQATPLGNSSAEAKQTTNDRHPLQLIQPSQLTEEILAQLFEQHAKGDLLYDHSRGRWAKWNEQRGCWEWDNKRFAYHFARLVCRKYNRTKDGQIADREFARASTYGGVERICQSSPAFAVTADRWDRDPTLLGIPGGVIDLRTGVRRDPRREDYITKQTAVAPDWDYPRPTVLDKFLHEITLGDEDLQKYLQRTAGYSLTGSIREELLFFIYGAGGNGKTKYVGSLAGAMGDYAISATMDTFVVKRGERHPTELARLAGARLVTASETTEGRRWDEALVKMLTGGDKKIPARFMRQDFFEFDPQFTLVIHGNYAPDLSNVDDANRRRFRIIPFKFKPIQPDQGLEDRLREEWPYILAWMIDGARDWNKEGLGPTPKCVSDETEEYFDEQDKVQEWIDEDCEIVPDGFTPGRDLFKSWSIYAKEGGVYPHTQTWLIKTLKRRGFQTQQVRGIGRGLNGIGVKPEEALLPPYLVVS
jgi:putative DNA primase/helicase